MLENLYTTKMSSSKKMLQKRFAKIRSKSGRPAKMMSLVVTLVLALALGTATVVMAALYNSDTDIKYEVYNGNDKIALHNPPFIYDSEYYLPLRDVLNGFGITDIAYDNGKIVIALPDAGADAPKEAKLEIGTSLIWYTLPDEGGIVMRSAPLLKNGITYVPEQVFEILMASGKQMPDFRLNVIRPTEPEYYYEKGENVFIGTAEQQDKYTLEHSDEIVKRIIIDTSGRTLVVIPVENQIEANIEEKGHRSRGWSSYDNYYNLFYGGISYNYNSKGEAFLLSGLKVIENGNKEYAYVSPANIIYNRQDEFSRVIRNVITNTYGE